jgi:pimeloyl-ACP methyl ester carboxylesterase
MIKLDDLIGDMSHLRKSEGFVEVKGGLRVKWWRYDNPTFDGEGRPPIVALHGGPAFTHNYILPMKLLADMGYPVVFYDQAGCGGSTFVADPATEAPWLLTVPYYVEELFDVITLVPASWATELAWACQCTCQLL